LEYLDRDDVDELKRRVVRSLDRIRRIFGTHKKFERIALDEVTDVRDPNNSAAVALSSPSRPVECRRWGGRTHIETTRIAEPGFIPVAPFASKLTFSDSQRSRQNVGVTSTQQGLASKGSTTRAGIHPRAGCDQSGGLESPGHTAM